MLDFAAFEEEDDGKDDDEQVAAAVVKCVGADEELGAEVGIDEDIDVVVDEEKNEEEGASSWKSGPSFRMLVKDEAGGVGMGGIVTSLSRSLSGYRAALPAYLPSLE